MSLTANSADVRILLIHGGFVDGSGWEGVYNILKKDGYSEASIIFGKGITSAVPGSTQGLQLTVTDIKAARAELISRGVDVSEVFHDVGGVFHHAGTAGRVPGPDPKRRSYGSFASFNDPDGNGWMMQEVTQRLPGRTW